MADPFVLQWACIRLSTLLGQDMSDVCEYIVNIEDEGELLAFVGGMLGEGEDANQFVADLRQTRVAAAAKKSEIEASVVPAGAPAEADNIKQSGKKGGGGGRGSGYLTGSSADRRMNKGGAQNLRDLSSQKAREAEEAQARLERNLQMAGASKSNSKVDLSALAPEDGMTAYVKQDEMDEFGLAHLKKDSKKKKAAQKGANRGGIDDALDGVSGVSGDENAAPSSQDSFKPKVSRAERAKMLLHMQSNSVFLAPGRHLTTWVGNGDEYKLVGNCLDCGKIMSNQEGEGPCLVCGSEQVFLVRTNSMLDGTAINEAIMAKRRRGGGGEGDTDAVDAQLRVRDAAEDMAFLRALDLRDSLLDFQQNRAERTIVIDDQSDFFDGSAHWLTAEQKREAAVKEKEFMDRVSRRRQDLPVQVSIDVAGRCIYGVDETPLFPEGTDGPDGAAAVPLAGGAGVGREAGTAGGGAGKGPARCGEGSGYGGAGGGAEGGAGKAGRRGRGPTVDLMGPTGKDDLSLGARHGVLKEQQHGIGQAALEGRAQEIYELLRASVMAADGGGRGGDADERRGGAGRERVQYDSNRVGCVCVSAIAADDEAEEDADGVVGCFTDELDGGAAGDRGFGGGCAGGAEVGGSEGAGVLEGLGSFVDDHVGDKGLCLSMHQPWASLAVHGVKQIEGRDWPTEHRGRLWIAATKRRPLESEVEAVLAQYGAIAEAREGLQPFYKRPESYPTSCLLGCVDVVDCVPGELLRQQADVGEESTDCGFGFVLDSPCRLTIPPHVLGQPKIYALDPLVVSRCQKQLRHVAPILD